MNNRSYFGSRTTPRTTQNAQGNWQEDVTGPSGQQGQHGGLGQMAAGPGAFGIGSGSSDALHPIISQVISALSHPSVSAAMNEQSNSGPTAEPTGPASAGVSGQGPTGSTGDTGTGVGTGTGDAGAAAAGTGDAGAGTAGDSGGPGAFKKGGRVKGPAFSRHAKGDDQTGRDLHGRPTHQGRGGMGVGLSRRAR
jgi:hypothetical protein